MTTEGRAPPAELAAALHQLDELIQMFSRHPDEGVQEAVVAMLRAVDVVHRGALRRLGVLLDARSLLDEALADPHVALLFDLYDAEEDDDERARAEAAVEAVRPDVEARGGRIEVVAAEGGVVNVRLLSPCEGCSGSAAALRRLVEDALRTELPEFVRMDVSPPAPAAPPAGRAEPALIPVSSVTVRTREQAPGVGGATGDDGGCG